MIVTPYCERLDDKQDRHCAALSGGEGLCAHCVVTTVVCGAGVK
jgi:hypothetical protein